VGSILATGLRCSQRGAKATNRSQNRGQALGDVNRGPNR
jgi:hypothetical protein